MQKARRIWQWLLAMQVGPERKAETELSKVQRVVG